MGGFKKILAAASPGELGPEALRTAVEFAVASEARLTVLDVIAPLPPWRRRMNVEGRTIDIEAALMDERENWLRGQLDGISSEIQADIVAVFGEPFLEVIRYVLAHGHDLVMLGEEHVDNAEGPRPSSGVMHVLRKCPAPVWVVRPPREVRLGILALVDPDPSDSVRDGLNDLVLEYASPLARRYGAELHLGHAWSLEGEATLRRSPMVDLPSQVVDVMVAETEAEHRSQLNTLVERHHLDDASVSIHLVPGDPGVALPRLADQLDVGLIVMGTVGRTGLQGLFMGNTADTILRSVHCSVLAVKPRGFATPVKLP